MSSAAASAAASVAAASMGSSASARGASSFAGSTTGGPSATMTTPFDVKKTSDEVFKACKSGKVQVLKEVLASVPGEHAKELSKAVDANGNTALYVVTNALMVQLLVDAGWYTEATNAQRQTPLHLACAGGEKTKAIARALIFAGANYDAKTLDKQTCLDMCTNPNTRKELRRYVNQAENERVVKSLNATEVAHFQAMFDVIDVERAGRVTVDAVRTLLGLAPDVDASDTTMSSFFDWWDFDQDGLMEFGDFVRVTRQLEEGLLGVDDMMSIAGHALHAASGGGASRGGGGKVAAAGAAAAGAAGAAASSALFLAVPGSARGLGSAGGAGGGGSGASLSLLSPMTRLLNGVSIDQVRKDLHAREDEAEGASGGSGGGNSGGGNISSRSSNEDDESGEQADESESARARKSSASAAAAQAKSPSTSASPEPPA